MKRRRELWLAILLGAILPGLLLHFFEAPKRTRVDTYSVTVLTEDGVVQMDVEKYLVGVLLKEMPGDFEDEALKAQAVAARTFALYRKENGSKHKNADICTSATCCQGYLDPLNYISNGGAASTVLKMYKAVSASKGQALYYGGDLIEATYFSSSGGRTEDARAVWGVAVPYLQSVESIERDAHYTCEINKDRFCEALGLTKGEVYIENPTYTSGGGIAEVSINGKTFTGMQLRQCLGLRSTCVSFYVGKESVGIITNGYGHRVGLSQYGADAMATGGSNYLEILTHYYTGVTVQNYTSNKN